MNEKTKNWLRNIFSLVMVMLALFLVYNNERNICEGTIAEYQEELSECNSIKKMHELDLRQCNNFQEYISESLWDCQYKLEECKK